MILCVYASSLTRSRNACTHKKKCKYKYIKDKQRDKRIHIAGVLQTNTSSVHLFSASSIFLSGK